MNPLNPLICGLWDGSNLWLQWEPDLGAVAYGVRTRYARPPVAGVEIAWEPWIVHRPQSAAWMVARAWKEGWLAQAEVRAYHAEDAADSMDAEVGWETAVEATFLKSICEFEISSEQRRIYYPVDSDGISAVFVALVDGAVCAYAMRGELEVNPGEAKKVTLEAHIKSGWCQLDKENHFDLRPSLGVRIRNTAPSVNDMQGTGRLFTQLLKGQQETVVVAFGGNRFNGG